MAAVLTAYACPNPECESPGPHALHLATAKTAPDTAECGDCHETFELPADVVLERATNGTWQPE